MCESVSQASVCATTTTQEFCHYLSVYIEHTSKSDPALQEVAVFCRQQFTDTMKFGTRKNAPQMEEVGGRSVCSACVCSDVVLHERKYAFIHALIHAHTH